MTEDAAPRRPLRRRLIGAARLTVAYLATVLAAAFLTVRLTARGSTVTVPALAGMDIKQVQQVLADRGLEMSVTGKSWHEQLPAGSVISQQPAANRRVKRGRRVSLTLSKGSEIIRMPALSGHLRLNEAEFRLRQLGLKTGGVTYIPSPEPKQTVLAQDPPLDTKVVRGRAVMLLVSDGVPAGVFAIPVVTGLPTPRALARLRQAGLKVTQVAYETTTRFTEGTIIAQAPPGGFRAIVGDNVKLRAARSKSTGQPRWISFSYAVADGPARRVRVLIVDEGGSREIANDIEEGGSTLRFSMRVQGEAVAQIFMGGTLEEERKL